VIHVNFHVVISFSIIFSTFVGHFSTQIPQDAHLDKSITGIFVLISMHFCGHCLTHWPHLMQAILQFFAVCCLLGLRLEHSTIAPFWSLGTSLIIACGHSVAQTPQPVHLAISTAGRPFLLSMYNAPNLHTLTQSPNPMQPYEQRLVPPVAILAPRQFSMPV
jgi:hypothetical protein